MRESQRKIRPVKATVRQNKFVSRDTADRYSNRAELEEIKKQVQKSVKNMGVYCKCPVCGKRFYIAPGANVASWAYKVKEKPVCSYGCSRKGAVR